MSWDWLKLQITWINGRGKKKVELWPLYSCTVSLFWRWLKLGNFVQMHLFKHTYASFCKFVLAHGCACTCVFLGVILAEGVVLDCQLPQMICDWTCFIHGIQ